MEESKEDELKSIMFVDESEVVIETAEEENTTRTLNKSVVNVKTENGDNDGSQGKGVENMIVSSIEGVSNAISGLPETCSWRQDSSNNVKRKRGRPRKIVSSTAAPTVTTPIMRNNDSPAAAPTVTTPIIRKNVSPAAAPTVTTPIMRKIDSPTATPTVTTPIMRKIDSPAAAPTVTTPVVIKAKRARKSRGNNTQVEQELNQDDLKHLEKPFTCGWRRELVYRNPTGLKSSNQTCDVYYFPPSGKKLRSMVEISNYLNIHTSSEVNLTHFTFRRQPLFKPPYETVRSAGKLVNKLLEQSAAVQTSAEKLKRPAVGFKNIGNPGKKSGPHVKVTAKKLTCSELVKQLATAAGSSLTHDKETTVKVAPPLKSVNGSGLQMVAPPLKTVNGSELQMVAPERNTAAREPVVQLVTSSQSHTIKKPGAKRKRPESPDWTPTSQGYVTMKKNGKIVKQTLAMTSDSDDDSDDDGGVGDDDDDDNDDDDDDDDDDSGLQNILGTPSKLIASIVRPESSNAATNWTGNCNAVSQNYVLSTPSSARSLINCASPANQQLLFVTSPVTTPALNDKGAAVGGIEPYHPCLQCGQRYIVCASAGSETAHNLLCPKCRRPPLTYPDRITSNPHLIQLEHPVKVQNLRSVPIAMHRVDSLGGPGPTSLVPVSSTVISTPLLTSSQLLPQVLSPVIFTPGQNAATIPPLPPLAPRPQFDTLTLVPITFTSSAPPPPRLQLCSSAQAGQSQPQLPPPPPLLLSHPLLLSSQANSTITELPPLQSHQSLLPSQSVALQTPQTSCTAEDVIDVDAICTDPLPRSLLTQTAADVQKHQSAADTAQSNSGTTKLTFGANLAQNIYHRVKDSNIVYCMPVGLCKPVQAGSNVLCAVKKLVTQRTRSDSISSDSFDCLPVQFEPSADNSSTERQNVCTPKTLDSVKEVVSDCHEDTEIGQPSKEDKCSALKGILRRPPVNVFREQEVTPLVLDSEDSAQSGSGTAHLKSSATFDAAANVEEADRQLVDVSHTDAPGVASSKDVCSAISTLEFTPLSSNRSGATTKHLLDLGAFKASGAVTPVEGPCPSGHPQEESGTCDRTTARKMYLSSFRILEGSFPVVMKIFTYLPVVDLLSSSANTKRLLDLGALKAPVAVMPSEGPCPSGHPQEESGTCDRTTARKMYLSSFRILEGSFPVVMKIFTYLPVVDLLRVSVVCKLWHTLAMQPSLWKCIHLKGIRVQNWEQATQFFHRIGARSLDLRGAILESTLGLSDLDLWENIKRAIPTLTQLKELFFHHVPAYVLNSITEKMPHLINIGAEVIIDTEVYNSAFLATVNRTVVNMSHAVEAVVSRQLATKDAARLFLVSEKDLIHLTQSAGKLTEDEEKAVILCCLRLSHMGFCVQLDTMVSKCQEMFARRFSTTTSIPVLDSYVRNLYVCNQPLFTLDAEIARSNNAQQRLEAHYSVLQKLYKSLWPRLAPNPAQVMAFDLKHFSLGRDPAFNTVRSVSVTVFSTMSANMTSLPSMAVWPRFVEATHASLINVISSRGLAAYYHVYNYFQKILNLVKIRPLVILCNGNASLLSEKLISSCVADGVYFHCVPPDVARYVFPGFHGGLLHLLKASVPEEGLSCEDFASLILFLLDKKIMVQQSAKLAFTTTGAFPVNPKAPLQYQSSDCTTPQQRPVSLLHPQTMNNLKGVALARHLQQSQTISEVARAETAQNDQVSNSTDKNMENSRLVTRKRRRKNQNSTEDTSENRVIEIGNITKKGRMKRKKRVGRKPANYKKNEGNARNTNKEKLQENGVIVINGEVAEKNVDTTSNKVNGISGAVQEDNVNTISDAGHKDNVDAVSVTVKVQQCSVNEKFHKVKKRQPVKFAKTIVGVSRKKKKWSYVRSMAWMLLYRAKRNIYVREQRHNLSNKGSVETGSTVTSGDVLVSCDVFVTGQGSGGSTKLGDSLSTNKLPSAEYSSRGKKQTKSPTDSRSKDSGTREQTKSKTQTGPGSKDSRSGVRTGLKKSNLVSARQQVTNIESVTLVNTLQKNGGETAEKCTESRTNAKPIMDPSGVESAPRNRINVSKDDGLISLKPITNRLSENSLRETSITREAGQEPVPGSKNGMSSDGEGIIKKKKKKNHHGKEKSVPDADESTAKSSESVSNDHIVQTGKDDEKSETEEGKTDKIKQSLDTSLIDHDYTVRYDGNESVADGGQAENSLDSLSEFADVPGVEVDLIPSSIQKSDTGRLVVASDEIIYVTAGENIAETVRSSQCADVSGKSDSSSSCSKCSRSSDSSSDDDEESSSAKVDSRHTTNACSDNESSKSSDESAEEVEENAINSSANSQENDDNVESTTTEEDTSDSEQTSEQDEGEEENEDDDSLCQICMRSVPPHSKNEVIDWVDCDKNCGRWFHVICITRSQAKADKKKYVCPSCRYI